MTNYREILRLYSLGSSQRSIAREVQSSRDTVADVIKAAKAAGITWPLDDDVANEDIQEVLFPGKYAYASPYTVPDYQWIHAELAKKGVTLTLLWDEYCRKVRSTGGVPYMYTQFCEKYRRWARVTKATMRITHKPGDAMQVDWAGDPLFITDSVTGELTPAYIFVAVLPCSWYTYAEACDDMKQENWLLCHVHAYAYFGGVTRLLIPDNAKTATITNNRYEVVLNRSYQEMAEHYGTAIVPARVRKPDDKAAVEGSVRFVSTWIAAALRDRKFFSIAEAKAAVQEKLEELNLRPFKKPRTGCRLSAYEQEEKDFMQPLPTHAYEPSVWLSPKVGYDYLVSDGLNKYSVPYALIGKKVDLILTKSVSRFARNTVDFLTTIRKLKEHGTEVYFEKESIWTFDSKGEMLLTILSSLSQEESRSISENVKWGQRKKFSDGKFSLCYGRFLGYEKGEDGTMVINKDQAQVVERIYGLFIAGLSPKAIAKRLTEEGAPTPGGQEKWYEGTVRSILKNEKYKGCALLQKTYTPDFLTKKAVKNDGSVPQYYVEDSHPAIIDPDQFQLVQDIFKERARDPKHSGATIFSGKIRCGCCGGWYGSKVWHSNDKYRRVVWQCNSKFKDKTRCKTPHLTEDEVKAAFIRLVNKLSTDREFYVTELTAIKDRLGDTTALEKERRILDEQLGIDAKAVNDLIAQNARVAQNQTEYNERYDALVSRYEETERRRDEVADRINQIMVRRRKLERFIETVEGLPELYTEFDAGQWAALVDSMTVHAKDRITFTLTCGMEIEE